jgi:hypothetical protein
MKLLLKFAISIFICGLIVSSVPAQKRSPRPQKPLSEYEKIVLEENKKHGWGEGKIKVGQRAPDFNLKILGSEQRVRLSSFAGKKPVALIFGTYTCPLFRNDVPTLNEMAALYKGKVEFLLVYIREAHTTDGWQDDRNKREGILLPSAKAIGEKEEHASMCVRNLDIKFTAVIDNMDNKVEQDYSAWPDRLYLVGKDGRIAYKGRPGTVGFVPAELAVAIETELERLP